ncbi:MAG: alpha/beta hydrolase, partial [Caldimonas sp.]
LMGKPKDAGSIDRVVDHYVNLYRTIGSPGYPADDAWLRRRLHMWVTRSYRPVGSVRHLIAVAADGDRSPLLDRIQVPTQVIHGQADPLIPVAAGHDLAAKIRGAKLDLVEGMGHDLPVALWPRFASGIGAAASRA